MWILYITYSLSIYITPYTFLNTSLYRTKEDDAKAAAAKIKLEKAASTVIKKKVMANVIDGKRAQNGGIALARIKLSFELVREKIKNMDESDFSPEQLKNLEDFLPNIEETRSLKGYNGTTDCLGKAENYMLVMMELPNAAKRLQCMSYKQLFKTRITELKVIVSKIENACDDVKLSAKFKKVLKTILKVGNTMNDSADQRAFSLDSLAKLRAAKAFDNKTSILQYVIMVLFKNDPTCVLFTEELSNVTEASRYTMEMVTSERGSMKQGLDSCSKVLTDLGDELPIMSQFITNVSYIVIL